MFRRVGGWVGGWLRARDREKKEYINEESKLHFCCIFKKIDMERGTLRSGERFAARNLAFYKSEKDLLNHHKRLLAEDHYILLVIVLVQKIDIFFEFDSHKKYNYSILLEWFLN